MLKQVSRSLARTRIPVIGYRLQSTVAKTEAVKVSQPEVSKHSKSKNGKKYPPRNQKLFDISKQIRNSEINQESISMLDEGLSYLREVQVAENISDQDLQFAFQMVGSEILYQNEQALEVLIQYRVAHKYHFALAASKQLKEKNYREILNIWVRFIEYEKLNGVSKMPTFPIPEFNVRPYVLNNLVYFAYVQSCLAEGIKVNYTDVLKLLQTEQLPFHQFIGKTFRELSLYDEFSKEVSKFNGVASKLESSNLDPNGGTIYKRIEAATDRKDQNALNNTFNEVIETSEKTKIPINEETMIRFMRGFLEASKPDEVFKIFQNMLKNGITKPSLSTWECVLKAMGHPVYISKNDHNTISENIERTVETIVSTTPLTAKTLSVIISSFANLNQFEKVEFYLNKYSVEGEGSLPVISHTKNNILIGLLLNDKVTEAEKKLNDYMESNFIPITSTMNTFLNYYVKKQDYPSVEGILKFMKDHKIPEDIATFTIVIDVYFKIHKEKGLTPNVNTILSTINSSNIQLNDFTYATLIDGLRGSNLDAARQIFNHAVTKYKTSPQIHTAMLKSELEYGSIPKAEAIFKKYITVVSNDTRVWNMMISALLRKNEGLALLFYENMKSQSSTKVEPNAFTYYFLLNHFSRRNNAEKVQYLIDELEERSIDLGAQIPRLLRGLNGEYKLGESLMKALGA